MIAAAEWRQKLAPKIVSGGGWYRPAASAVRKIELTQPLRFPIQFSCIRRTLSGQSPARQPLEQVSAKVGNIGGTTG